ncbi:hypothetical protein [Mycoplasma sp. 125]|uniref:hypothetical protein n=1 Tax=Mycoplasma sp. 125 TaxID=3447505 RepID=UPI003F65E9A0
MLDIFLNKELKNEFYSWSRQNRRRWKFDGYFVYETSRKDLKLEEIVLVYRKQYQIEENLKTLK